jgi:hypothetical protein
MIVEAYQVFMMGVHLVFVNSLTKNIIKVKLRGVDILLVRYAKWDKCQNLSYKNNRNSIVLSVSLIVSIIITNSFIVFSPDENSRSYFSNLTSTVTVGIPMVIAFVMVLDTKEV